MEIELENGLKLITTWEKDTGIFIKDKNGNSIFVTQTCLREILELYTSDDKNHIKWLKQYLRKCITKRQFY